MMIFALLVLMISAALWAVLENGQEKDLVAYCRLECKEYKAYPGTDGDMR